MKCPKCHRSDVYEIKHGADWALMGCNCGQAFSVEVAA